jgi:hypothetical protein
VVGDKKAYIFFVSLCFYSRKEQKIRHAFEKCHHLTCLCISNSRVSRRVSVLGDVENRLPSDAASYPSRMESCNHTNMKPSELEWKFVFVVNNACKGANVCWLALIRFLLSHSSLWQYSGKQITLYLILLYSNFLNLCITFQRGLMDFFYCPIHITRRVQWLRGLRCLSAAVVVM